MIFRIGSRKAVTKRLQQATNVMFRTCDSYECDLDHCDRCSFNSNSYSHNYDDFVVSLASLPGVESFTDRSLVGLLKTYAGLHRDKCVTRWQRDYRLSSLDKNSAIDMVFGLDAGKDLLQLQNYTLSSYLILFAFAGWAIEGTGD